MTARQWTYLLVAILLGGISLYLNRDWFAREDIQIYHRSSPRPVFGRRSAPASPAMPVSFGFNRNLSLKSVKVVYLEDAATNKYPRAIWHLASESNSIPTKTFIYGVPIRGMHPAVKGAAPENLTPGTRYRLLVEAQDFKGQHDFVPIPKTR